jgi:hypothetical protein
MRGATRQVPSTTAKKVDNKLIAEDFKKYEDKTSKKIKPGKHKFLQFTNHLINRLFRKNGFYIRSRHLPRCKIIICHNSFRYL